MRTKTGRRGNIRGLRRIAKVLRGENATGAVSRSGMGREETGATSVQEGIAQREWNNLPLLLDTHLVKSLRNYLAKLPKCLRYCQPCFLAIQQQMYSWERHDRDVKSFCSAGADRRS